MKDVTPESALIMVSLAALAIFTCLPGWAASPEPSPTMQGTVSAPAPAPPGFEPSVSARRGTVAQYLMTPHGDVDGVLLTDGTQVHFPPHMAKDLVKTVKPDDSIEIRGYKSLGGPVLKAFMITNAHSGQSVIEREPTWMDRPFLPPHLMSESSFVRKADGTVRTVLYGPRGDVNGAVLEDQTIIRISPHAAHQAADLLQTGQAISVAGYGTENDYGRVIEATALGAPGNPMMPVDDPGRGVRR